MSNESQPRHEAREDAYAVNGYKDRAEYLDELAEGSSNPEAVWALADILGESEDFDGLVSIIEDFGL